jgi:hypothetical protein
MGKTKKKKLKKITMLQQFLIVLSVSNYKEKNS